MRIGNIGLPGQITPGIRYAPEDGSSGGASEGSQEGRDGQAERTIPYNRFKEVNDMKNAYEALGSPEEIAEIMSNYAQLQDALNSGALDNQEGDPKPAPKSKAPSGKTQQAIETLYEYIPGLKDLPQLREAIESLTGVAQSLDQRSTKDHNARANDMVRDLIIKAGYVPADYLDSPNADSHEEVVGMISNFVANSVYSDPKMKTRFTEGDLSVVKEAFQRVDKTFEGKINKVKPKKLPSAFGPQGAGHYPDVEGLDPDSLKGKSKDEIKKIRNKASFDYLQRAMREKADAEAFGA